MKNNRSHNRGAGKFALALACALAAFPALAEIRSDVHIQSNGDSIRLDIDQRTYKEVLNFFQSGYPVASVLMHAVSQGMSINDAVYLAIKANRDRAEEIYQTAQSMLPSLPGWACHSAQFGAGRYYKEFTLKELGAQPTVAEVAKKFFDEDKRMAPFPSDWKQGKAHMNASVAELDKLLSNQWWYQKGKDAPSAAAGRPVFVSLYKGDKSIVVDDNFGQVEAAKKSGKATLPVVFLYNDKNVYPVRQLGEKPTAGEVASRFFNSGQEATPVPDWSEDNYHVLADRSELEGMFDAPPKDQVPPARWTELMNELKGGGFKEPLKVSLLSSKRMWADDPAKITAAKAAGVNQVPVVFFFHSIGRNACGQSGSTCQDIMCEAAIAAGADPSVCKPGNQPGGELPPPAPGGGVISPSRPR